ncbi:MAG: ACR3 family arsenite efflux transporter [Sphaerochaeta sp.]|jgi:ACR3 family arsenite transporter|nr:ACR3 family arsenite efflux transporter [Sphaerochaeta sp.]
MKEPTRTGISRFEQYLSVWVLICMAIGVAIGVYAPAIPLFLSRFEYASVSMPVAILIWIMIYPMMLKIDFSSIKDVGRNPRGLVITWVVNWLIKPFTMYLIARLFFFVFYRGVLVEQTARQYLAGAILLGAAPCTAMVFVWSHLVRGNPAYTLVQVATNDLIILALFVPITGLLLGISGITIPWATLLLSVLLFVVLPLAAAWLTRSVVIKRRGEAYLEEEYIPKFNGITTAGLLLTLIIIFSFQGRTIIENPAHILLIALPLSIQTIVIFFIAYLWARGWKLSFDVAAPAAMIGASNFFELAVAVAISLFGLGSGATVATVVGVLVEVPLMLLLVSIAKRSRHWFAT